MFTLIRDTNNLSDVHIDPHLPIFCDTETTTDEGLSSGGLYGKIRLVQMYQETWTKAVIVDCFFVPLDRVLPLLKPCKLIFHGGAYDLHTINLKTDKVWLPEDLEDTLYLSRLKYYTKQKFGFYECLSYAKLDDELIKSISKKELQQSDWSGPLSEIQKLYAAADVVYLAKLYNVVKECNKQTVYALDIISLKLAVEYSRNGMPINQKTVTSLKLKYMTELEDVLETLPINPRSSTQSKEYLGVSSSDSDTLIKLIQEGNERARLVQNGRHCYKSLEYLDAYDRPVLKGFFQPSTSLSGRFSCTGGNSFSHANLQQMPEKLHSVVEAPEGYEIVYKDYSGLELRMAVAYTGEPVMAALMKAGQDLHTETAKFLFSKDKVTVEERTVAKTFNFCLIYGGGIGTAQNTLAIEANVHMKFEEVKYLKEKWFSMYEYYDEWHKLHKNAMNVYGYIDVETALGRRVRAYKLTDSLNIPIQGSSVEVTKVSLINLKKRHPDAYIINTIHDANLLLAKTEEAEMWGTRLSEAMVDAWKYVTEDLAEPDILMPHGFEHGPIWKFH